MSASGDLREERLSRIRERARRGLPVPAPGFRPEGAPFPRTGPDVGYYGMPLLKKPVWTWEVPLYFFVGGAAGSAAVVAAVARARGGSRALVRDARWIAALGGPLGAALLTMDLGRPLRFVYMLRVFKPQSAMSMGAWLLSAFSAAAFVAAATSEAHRDLRRPRPWMRRTADAAGAVAALTGLGMGTYTGVLIGVTAVPAWNENVRLLPFHFGASALASATGLLELMGHRDRPLRRLGIAAALAETAVGARLETRRTPAQERIRRGWVGLAIRAGGVLSGPVPLLLRLIGRGSRRAERAAALCALAGSMLTRIGWWVAGPVSAADGRVPLGLEPGARTWPLPEAATPGSGQRAEITAPPPPVPPG